MTLGVPQTQKSTLGDTIKNFDNDEQRWSESLSKNSPSRASYNTRGTIEGKRSRKVNLDKKSELTKYINEKKNERVTMDSNNFDTIQQVGQQESVLPDRKHSNASSAMKRDTPKFDQSKSSRKNLFAKASASGDSP